MKRLSKDQINQIIELYQKGKSPSEIGDIYGIFNNSVTRILRKNGIARNQLIKISEEESKEIISLYTQGYSSELIAIQIDRDPATVCRVLRRHGAQIRPATENKRKYKINDTFFENIDSEEKAYFLGILYADGNVSKRGSQIKISLKDEDLVRQLSKIIYNFEKIYKEDRVVEGRKYTYYSLSIYSQKIKNDLSKLGCVPAKTFSIRLPSFIKESDLCPHFIRGYFDGDGCISIDCEERTKIDITSNHEFVKDLISFFKEKLNIDCYFGTRKNSACLQFSAQQDVDKFVDYIYNDASIFLQRKKDKSEDFKNLLVQKKISKIKNINNYDNFFIPTINGIELNSYNLKKLSQKDKDNLIQPTFEFYRENGFPYTYLTNEELITQFNFLKKFNALSIAKDKRLSISNYLCTDVFKHFSPHFYEMTSTYDKRLSMLDAFNDDVLLKKVIKNRIDQNFNLHGSMIKQGLRNSRNAYNGSIFNTLVAKFIYSKFTKNSDVIYDYSMGYGQRLLAALSLGYGCTYIGVDPFQKSFESNQNIYNFYNQNIKNLKKTIDLRCTGSEDFCDEKYLGKVNFAFSSPPYFDLEVYCDDATQAYQNGYDDFINRWWMKSCENISRLLKDDGVFAINIADKVKSFNLSEDMCSIIKSFGFVEFDRYHLVLARNLKFRKQQNKNEKLESIIFFKRI